MFSTPLICSSIGVATVLATVSALAPGIGGADRDRGRRDFRILRDRQGDDRERAGDDRDDGNHGGENRPIDEKMGEVHETPYLVCED